MYCCAFVGEEDDDVVFAAPTRSVDGGGLLCHARPLTLRVIWRQRGRRGGRWTVHNTLENPGAYTTHTHTLNDWAQSTRHTITLLCNEDDVEAMQEEAGSFVNTNGS